MVAEITRQRAAQLILAAAQEFFRLGCGPEPHGPRVPEPRGLLDGIKLSPERWANLPAWFQGI
jgi:hypothetical protein